MDAPLFHLRFMRAAQRFRRLQCMNLDEHMSRLEFMALEALRQHLDAHPQGEGMYVSALAGVSDVSMPAVSRALRSLEAKGWIERHVDRADRRNTYISLTPIGEAARADARERFLAFMGQVFDEMGEDNIRALLSLQERFIRIAEARGDLLNKGERACSE